MKYCNEEILNKIDTYISDHRDEIVDTLMELVRIPSVISEPAEGAPFGVECARMIRATAELYEANGFRTDIRMDSGYALSYFGNGDKSIGIFAHTDVVPVDDKWTVCQPFEPVIRDGYIFGRGCGDDKAGVIQSLYAAKIIKESGLDFNSRLVMFSGSNEESSMADAMAFSRDEQMPDISFIPDGIYPCICGERILKSFYITSRKPLKYIRSLHGGDAFNVILGQLDAEIVYSDELMRQISDACAGDERFAVSTDGKLIYVSSRGISSHIMHSEKALNAAKLMIEMLCGCDALGEDAEIMRGFASYLADNIGTGFGIAHDDVDFGRLVCGNGMVSLTDDGRIKASFDARIGLSFDIDEVERRIIAACGDDWEYEAHECSMGYNIPDDDPVKRLLEGVYSELSGEEHKGVRMAGGTYARRLQRAIPVGKSAPYKEKPAIDLPAGHGGGHQPDEMLSIDGLLEAIKILTCYILETDKLING